MHVSAVSSWVGSLAGWSRMASTGMAHLQVSFIPQQHGLVVAGQGARRAIRSTYGLLKPKLGSQTTSPLSHSVGQFKLQSLPTFKGWGANRLYPLMEEAVKPH